MRHLQLGIIDIDFEHRKVIAANDRLLLTANEFDVLSYLTAHANTTVTHGELSQAVCGRGHEDEQECLCVLISHLRKTIESSPRDPKYLLTDFCVGYGNCGPFNQASLVSTNKSPGKMTP